MNIQTDHRVGARIRSARESAGVDREQLAHMLSERTGQHEGYLVIDIARLEDGRDTNVSVTMVAAIAKALDCSLLYLLGVEDG